MIIIGKTLPKNPLYLSAIILSLTIGILSLFYPPPSLIPIIVGIGSIFCVLIFYAVIERINEKEIRHGVEQ